MKKLTAEVNVLSILNRIYNEIDSYPEEAFKDWYGVCIEDLKIILNWGNIEDE